MLKPVVDRQSKPVFHGALGPHVERPIPALVGRLRAVRHGQAVSHRRLGTLKMPRPVNVALDLETPEVLFDCPPKAT
jgi:hypothetical protein